ncbi:MAG: hypothetical protein K2K31_00845, partial [Clostridia bacterium]|nr:hypothetical protein [Clostridia bacterium]
IDLTDGVYFRLATNVLGADVEVLVLDNKLYISLDELKYKSNLYNVSELVDIFKQMFGENRRVVARQSESDFDADQIMNILANFDVVLTNEKLELSGQVEGLNIKFLLADEQRITRSKAPKNCDDLKKFVELVENIKTYIDDGVYEFNFTADYNGLILNGTFKYFENKMEISVLDLFGEDLYVNIQDNYIFVNYANMKFKVAVPQNQGSSDFDLTEILNTLTSDKLGVDIDFGGLQTIIDMLCDYTVKDYIENLKLTASENEITLTLNYANKTLASLIVDISDNKLSGIDVNCSVLSGNVTVNYVKESTINEINASEYENYTTDIIDGVLDSFKISEGVYSFSTDLAVRYSTNQFYGNLVGLLIKDDNHEGLINGYVPAVALYTDSLGLDSYIYLVDNTVYVSIAGLQVYADINETTINDIMDLASKFTSTEVAETVDAFKVCLPSLTEIYGQWVYEITEESQSKIGVQIDIKDSLYYTSQARFYDIVAKVIMQKDGNKLLPIDITLGANIDDPNTKLNENGYKDYLLTKNGALIEDYNLTGNLNFAIYLYNLTAGSASQISDIFAISEDGKLEGFVINNVVANISDFHIYSELFPLLSAYDYFTSYNYQIGLSGKVASESQVIKINDASDITIKLSPLTDSIFDDTDEELGDRVRSWFDNNYLKVLGDIDINVQNLQNNSDVEHKLSMFYESNDTSELYVSYSHGDLIGNKEFNAKVKNSNLSTLVSMIVSVMGIEMSEEEMASWGLEHCTTDFEYLQKLLNIDTSKDEDNSSIDDMLQTVSNLTNVLDSVKLDTSDKDVDGNYATTISINLKETFGNNASIKLIVSNNEKDEVVTSKLDRLVIAGVSVGGMTIDLEISFDEFKEENFDYDTTKEHIDISTLTEFVDVAVSTLNTQNMAFNGNTSIGIIGIDAITVYYDLLVEFSDSGELSLYLEMVVPSFVDVTYNAGGFGNTYTVYSAFGFDKRVSTLEYKNGVLNLVQNTYGNKYTGWAAWKKRDEVITKSWKADEIGSHIMEIFSYMLGLTDSVYNKIGDLIASMNPNPTLEQTIMSYAPILNGETLTDFTLGLEGKTLTGDANFDNMNVEIDLSDAYVVNGVEYRFVETISTKIGIKNDTVSIPLKLNSTTGTSYVTTGGKTIYSNDYYRKQYLKKFA